jgi:hypothetical protein
MAEVAAIQLMSEEQLNEVGQIIQRCLPEGTLWILVAVPPHQEGIHPAGHCPVQTATNFATEEWMRCVLEGAAGMFAAGSHTPLFSHPVEKSH